MKILKSVYISRKSKFSGNIISLLASTTEILCALGLKEKIVGISHECDNPIDILDLPRISKPNININNSSKDINTSVENSVFNKLPIYNLDMELLKTLKPKIIFTQDMCNVCAVSQKDLNNYFSHVSNSDVEVISYSPNSLTEILKEIKFIGEKLDCEFGVNALLTDLKIRLKTFKQENQKEKKPSVAFIEWIEPIYFGGNWIPELINYAGGKYIFGEPGVHSSIISFDEIVSSDPDYILIAPCGFNIDKTLEELEPFLKRPEWRFLKAVRNNNVYVLDGNKYFNRPGMGIITSVEIIAEIIHSEKFIYQFENIAWVRLNQIENF
ncbi:MAG: cobalamin-binding protein [Candidatus Marinimicrobia bacterium]|nr:cobalamin-binding protein [Candidatus Neomarinimicrobiota bacterium]